MPKNTSRTLDTETIELLKRCKHLIGKALEFDDGDVFGVDNNEANDVLGEIEVALDEKPKARGKKNG